MGRIRSIGTIVVAGALVVGATACGGSGSSHADRAGAITVDVGAAKAVSLAADRTADEKTARVEGSMDISIAGVSEHVPITGRVDFGRPAMEMKIDMGELLGGSGSDMEMRLVDKVMYLRMPGGLPDATRNGKPWLKMDLSQYATSPILGGSASDPTSTLQYLRGAGDVTEVGKEELRGVATTRYHAEIDLLKAMEKVPAADRDRAEAGIAALGRSLPMDVWIDADGRVRKTSVDMTVKVAGRSTHVGETIEYLDFGTPVDIAAPPADETGDFRSAFPGGLLGAAEDAA
jgi:hypothetical protein